MPNKPLYPHPEEIASIIFRYWTTETDVGDPKFYKPAFPAWVANSQCGSQQGEYSLLWPPPSGDRVHGIPTAHGAAQWHHDREDDIRNRAGIDIRSASCLDQQRAIWWEIKNKMPACLAALKASDDEAQAVAALVDKFEFSGDRARDKARRTDYALHWKAYFKAHPQ